MEQKLIELWNQGISGKEIAARLKITENAVFSYAKANRDLCPDRRKLKKPPVFEHSKFVELWNQGVSTSNMAKEFNVSKAVIQSYAIKNREECPIRQVVIADKKKLVELWNQGLSSKEIANKLGVSSELVRRYAMKHRNLCTARKNKYDTEKIAKLWFAESKKRDCRHYCQQSLLSSKLDKLSYFEAARRS